MSERERIRVLLVDDEVDFLQATATALGRRGYEVTTAMSALQAQQSLSDAMPDVAVLDLLMPGTSGEELFQWIARHLAGLPVIILTGHGTVPHAFQMSREGVFDYVAKPVDLEVLAERLRAAVASAKPSSSTASPGADLMLDGLHLLIVDDEQELLDSLTTALGRRGILVATASSGEEALTRLSEEIVDVVLLDIRMPGTDGHETLGAIHRRKPDVEVVLLTGHPSVASAVEGVRQGAFDYLLKPVDVSVLVQVLQKAWQKRKSASDEVNRSIADETMRRIPD